MSTPWLPPLGGSTASTLPGWSAVEQVFRQQIQAAGIVGGSILVVQDGKAVATAM
jgi:hypothetical protein